MFDQIKNIVLNHMYGESEEGCQIVLTRLSDDVIMGAVSITLEPGVLDEHARTISLHSMPVDSNFVVWMLQHVNHLKDGQRFIDVKFQMTAIVEFDGELKDFRILGASTDTKAALKLLHDELYVLCREDRVMTSEILENIKKSGSDTYIEGTGVSRYADLFLN